MNRLLVAGCGALVASVITMSAAHGSSTAPSPIGSVPVSSVPTAFGTPQGENGGALSSCSVRGRRLVVVSGDVDAYRAARQRSGVTRVFVLDAETGAKLSSIDVSGKTAGVGAEQHDAGFVQAVLCRTVGSRARVYIGGSFTRVFGRARQRTAMVELVQDGNGLKRSLSRWQVASSSTVTAIEPSPRHILVAGGARLVSVHPTTAKVRWKVRARCGAVRTARYAAGKVYAGGFFDVLLGTDGTVSRNHGIAKINTSSGRVASTRSFRTAIPPNRTCSSYSGANPVAIVHDPKRKRLILCEAGIRNGVRAVSRRSGRQAWFRPTDGDAQACAIVRGRLFVGIHRSGGNVVLDERGCGSRSCGTMGAFFSLTNGHQFVWMPPTADFAGVGRNRDGRNNGINGITTSGRWLFVAGAFDRVGRVKADNLARFAIR